MFSAHIRHIVKRNFVERIFGKIAITNNHKENCGEIFPKKSFREKKASPPPKFRPQLDMFVLSSNIKKDSAITSRDRET